MTDRRRTPVWAWLVIVVLASLQPAAHLVITYASPQGMVPTGMHIPDSALFIQAMDMFNTGFESKYATNLSDVGPAHYSYFSIGHLWFYGIQGAIADTLGVGHFLFYGLMNGLAAFLFLWVVYRFFVTVIPDAANVAFALFALGGGIGGVLYVVTGVSGLHDAPQFEPYFWRFAIYELVEGAHLFPATYYARSYYTTSLACCLGGLTVFIHALGIKCPRHAFLAGLILLAGAFINIRFATYTVGLVLLIMVNRRLRNEPAPVSFAAIFLGAGAIGWLAGWGLMLTNPAIIRNHADVGDMNMYLSPFVSASLLVLPVALWQCFRRAPAMPKPWRTLTYAGLGYLIAFASLFTVYQIYMGNILIARDAAVAVAISDYALPGGVLGGLYGYRLRFRPIPDGRDWIIIWFLGFLCLSISAFGQGWFLRFGPQRLMLMLYLPMAALTAMAIIDRRTSLKRAYLGTVTACGVVTIIVSTFWFQAPLSRAPHPQPFDWTHTSVITEADAELISQIPATVEAGRAVIPATVLAPLPASDVVAMMRGNPVVFGIGSFNMSREPYAPMAEIVDRFFSPDMSARDRLSVILTFRPHYVLCPDTWPCSEETIAALDKFDVLKPVAEAGRGRMWTVDWPRLDQQRMDAGAHRASSADGLLRQLGGDDS